MTPDQLRFLSALGITHPKGLTEPLVESILIRSDLILSQLPALVAELRQVHQTQPRPGTRPRPEDLQAPGLRLLEAPLDLLPLLEGLVGSVGGRLTADDAFKTTAQRRQETLARKRQAAAKARAARGLKRVENFKDSPAWAAHLTALGDLDPGQDQGQDHSTAPQADRVPQPEEELF